MCFFNYDTFGDNFGSGDPIGSKFRQLLLKVSCKMTKRKCVFKMPKVCVFCRPQKSTSQWSTQRKVIYVMAREGVGVGLHKNLRARFGLRRLDLSASQKGPNRIMTETLFIYRRNELQGICCSPFFSFIAYIASKNIYQRYRNNSLCLHYPCIYLL